METESIVDSGIDLETGDLGPLAFSTLDTDSSATTDGNLLSSLSAGTITDDISTTSVLTILPQMVSNFPRGLTPTGHNYGLQNIAGSMQTTSGYELTDLSDGTGIDTSCKLVTDSNDILLGANTGVGMSCISPQQQTHQNHEPVVPGSATWSHDSSITFTSTDQHHIDSEDYVNGDPGMLNINKFSEFKTFNQSQAAMPSVGTYLTTTTKTANSFIQHNQQQTYGQIIGTNGNLHITKAIDLPSSSFNICTGQQGLRLNHGQHHQQHHQESFLQELKFPQINNSLPMKQQHTSMTTPTTLTGSLQQHIPELNNHGFINNSPTFSIRLPITTPLGKGLHLQLVAKGQRPVVLGNNTSINQQQRHNIISNDTFLRGNISQAPQTNNEGGFFLLQDKSSGKNYVLPNKSGPVINKLTLANHAVDNIAHDSTEHSSHQVINIGRATSPCLTPIDVVGNSDMIYGDLGISEPQPVIDVNEFLNIPPKIVYSNDSNAGSKNDIAQTSGGQAFDLVNGNEQDIRWKEGISSSYTYHNNNVISVSNNEDYGKKVDLHEKVDVTSYAENDLVQNEILTVKNEKLSKDKMHEKSPEVEISLNSEIKHKENNCKSEQKISNALTGEDLIKMMAVKKCDRQQNLNLASNKTDNKLICFSNSHNTRSSKMVKGGDSKESNFEVDEHLDKSLPNESRNGVHIFSDEDNTLRDILQTDDEHSKDVSFDESELNISIHSEEGEMDSSIMETEQRIASIVPESMKDFVRDIFEDEDALDKEYIQEIMDDTCNDKAPAEAVNEEDSSSALSPGEIAKHAVQKLATGVDELKGMDVKAKLLPAVSVQIDKSQVIKINGIRKWKCNICPKMYSTKHNLVTHILGHCEIKPHCCMLCGKLFKQPSHLRTHMLTHQQIKAHVCKVCERSFTQASHLKRHSIKHMQRNHVCDICNRGFVYLNDLRSHKEQHSNTEPKECEKCDNVFDSVKKLKQHCSTEHKDTEEVCHLTCKECNKVFVYPSQLRDHMMKHSGVRPFICTECGMDFMKEHHLKAHQFTHTGEKPFQCMYCERTFNQKANLQRHLLIHDENKRYKCDKCGREFSQPQVLKSHIQTHTGKKQFKCEECGKEFSRQHNLNGHMALHQGNKKYVCFCGASFTLKGNLNRHQKKHNHNDEMSPISVEHEIVQPTQSAEEIAAETAAKILNMMSAKRTMVTTDGQDLKPTNDRRNQNKILNSDIEGSDSLSSALNDDISYRIVTNDGKNNNVEIVIHLEHENGASNDFSVVTSHSKEFGEVEIVNLNEDESPLPKKKRKSVPSKIISKEGNIDNNTSETTDGECNNIDNNIININVPILPTIENIINKNDQTIELNVTTVNTSATTPIKRKQLKPKCLPLVTGKNNNNKCAIDSGGDNNNKITNTPSSTRRKQKAAVKASVLSPVEVADEAEQEWQGTDSRSGMEQTQNSVTQPFTDFRSGLEQTQCNITQQ